MAFDTSIRNPERFKSILKIVNKYDGILLNDENILNIVSELYLSGECKSDSLQIEETTKISDIRENVKYINSTRNADGGFPKGYASRFWTYMRTPSELGFVYAEYNQIFKISNNVKRLLNEELDEQELFSMQAMKYNRMSPFRRVLNDYNYFKFILGVLLELEKENKTLSYNEFIISLFSETGNVEEFIKIIKENKFNNDEYVVEYIANNYNVKTKHQTLMVDYPDVVLRMLRICGFITIEYKGILRIKVNSLKKDFINRIIAVNTDINEEEKEEKIKYYEKLNIEYKELNFAIKLEKGSDAIVGNEYVNKLDSIIQNYNITEDKIVQCIKDIGTKNKIPEEFKYIPDPIKLEFYFSLLLNMKYNKEMFIQPNYKADELGFPISHAPGNVGDIEVYNDKIYWLIELTLIRNKQQQLNNETTSVVRHVFSNVDNAIKNKYLSFSAPYIHRDTLEFYENTIINYKRKRQDIFLKTYTIDELIEITIDKKNLQDMEKYTSDFFKTLQF